MSLEPMDSGMATRLSVGWAAVIDVSLPKKPTEDRYHQRGGSVQTGAGAE